MRGTLGGLVISAMLGTAAPALGQARSISRGPHVRGVSFALARYTAVGSLSLYAAHSVGPGFVLIGAAANPHTNRRVGILGAGTDVRLTVGSSIMLALAGARATDGYSLRLYMLPRAAFGRVVTAATVTSYLPLGGGTRRRVTVDPLTIVVRTTPMLRPGLAVLLGVTEGRPPEVALGPTLQVRVDRYQLAVDVLPVGLTRTQARIAFSTTF